MRKSNPEAKILPKPAPPGWRLPALLTLTAVLLLGLFSPEFADSDAWWHLKTGEYIVTNHRLPSPDPFSYTTAAAKPGYPGETSTRQFNLTHEWLSQSIWYLIFQIAGFPGVVLWRALLLTVLCAAAGYVAKLRTESWLWGIAAALAAAALAVHFAHDRPSIVSLTMTALFIVIFEKRRHLWIIPMLTILWANLHGGFFLGWVVCAAYSADALLRREQDARHLLTVSVVTMLVSGINPNVFGVFNTLLRYRQSAMTSTLMEWSRPSLWGFPYAFDILLYLAAITLAISWRRVRPVDWILFVAFGIASLMAFRNTMLIGLLAPILVATYFPWKRALPIAVPFAGAMAMAAALIWGVTTGTYFQLRAAEWRYPAGAATFLQDSNIATPLFNTYENGGYLIWRGLKVFIDGRALSESVFEDYRKILGLPAGAPERRDTLARYGAGAILLNGFEYNSGFLYPLVLDLGGTQADWKLVYEDPQAMVFLRDVPSGMPVLDKARIFDHLEAECQMHVERDPEFSLCARTLADFFIRAGDRPRARKNLAFYLEHPYGADPQARKAYMELLRSE